MHCIVLCYNVLLILEGGFMSLKVGLGLCYDSVSIGTIFLDVVFDPGYDVKDEAINLVKSKGYYELHKDYFEISLGTSIFKIYNQDSSSYTVCLNTKKAYPVDVNTLSEDEKMNLFSVESLFMNDCFVEKVDISLSELYDLVMKSDPAKKSFHFFRLSYNITY
jgi:hypothetical protein